MTARCYATLAAETAADIDVEYVAARDLDDGEADLPFALVIGTWPLTSRTFLGRSAAEVAVQGLMRDLTAHDPAATGELLDRLVAIVAGEKL